MKPTRNVFLKPRTSTMGWADTRLICHIVGHASRRLYCGLGPRRAEIDAMTPGRSLRSHGVPILVPLVAIAIAFHDVIGPGRGFFYRDHIQTFKPLWWAIV